MNETVSNPVAQSSEEIVMTQPQVIKSEPSASKVIQEACRQEPVSVVAQNENKAVDDEERLKALIANEENPLKSYLPA